MSDQNIKLTIVTPTFGRHGLKRAIDSVDNSSYQNWEHLVVFDGQEWEIDNSPFAHPNRKFLCSNKEGKYNDGGSLGRNVGIRHASGDYIVCLDDDNYYTEKGLENVINALPENCPWAVFPILRFGRRFFYKNLCFGQIDMGQLIFQPEINGVKTTIPYNEKESVFLENGQVNPAVYASDWNMTQKLMHLHPPVFLDQIKHVLVLERQNFGR